VTKCKLNVTRLRRICTDEFKNVLTVKGFLKVVAGERGPALGGGRAALALGVWRWVVGVGRWVVGVWRGWWRLALVVGVGVWRLALVVGVGGGFVSDASDD